MSRFILSLIIYIVSLVVLSILSGFLSSFFPSVVVGLCFLLVLSFISFLLGRWTK